MRPRSDSVVIPMYNAAATLDLQLGALADQEGGPPAEIIIADNGSTDDSCAVASSWKDRLPIQIIDASQRSGSAYARNQGAAHSSGDLLLFCDADDVVSPGWRVAMRSALESHDIVGGPLIVNLINDDAVSATRPRSVQDRLNLACGFLPFAPSGNLGVQRSVWIGLGGMNEEYLRSHDVEFSWRAALRGHSIGFAAGAELHYRYRSSARGNFRQGFVSGRAGAQLYSDYRDAGMNRQPLKAVVRSWVWLVVRSPRLFHRNQRLIWMRQAGSRTGAISGSLKYRVLYL